VGGTKPTFLFMITETLRTELESLIRGLGLELLSAEWRGTPGRGELQLTIDREGGVTVGDCETVSRNAGVLLDLKNPFPGKYTLKVLSPGIDRELKGPGDFKRFTGKAVRFHHAKILYKARLLGATEDTIQVEVGGKPLTFALSEISRARLLAPWEEEE
jgi:ribosome maturation factor RimP